MQPLSFERLFFFYGLLTIIISPKDLYDLVRKCYYLQPLLAFRANENKHQKAMLADANISDNNERDMQGAAGNSEIINFDRFVILA